MIIANLPPDEALRIEALRSYDLIDTLPEAEYDDIVRLAAHICQTPIATFTLVDSDRQWFKSAIGLSVKETGRDEAFCSHTILEKENPMLVSDAKSDPRFFDNPLVTGEPNIGFYAGFPVVDEANFALGSLCVMDHNPRKLSKEQEEALTLISRMISRLLKVRKERIDAISSKLELDAEHGLLEQAVNSSSDHFFVIDARTMKFIAFNHKALNDLEYSKQELLRMGPADLTSISNVIIEASFNRLINENLNQIVFETKLKNRNGQATDVEILMRQIEKKPFLIANVRDITNRKILEKELQNSLELLEERVVQRTHELNLQKLKVEELHKEVKYSITYASRLQKSMFCDERELKAVFPSSFSFQQPRDIVSGDFFFVKEQDQHKILVLGDCTGHGVPAGFISVLGLSGLKMVMKDFKTPASILDNLNYYIKQIFNREEDNIQDGMDISILFYDQQHNKLTFSAANHSLWIVRHGELIIIKGNRQPIGHFQFGDSFINNETTVELGDRIFLFTDGIHDQFGGSAGKKLKKSGLKDLLLATSVLGIEDQKKEIIRFIGEWKGELQQTDDICLVGFEV